MSLPDGLHLRAARPDELPRIAELRESVGWASHDWALRAVVDAPHARCFVVTDASGRMVGVGSGISYEAFGVVGNMIVAPEHRRRGIGAAILEGVLAFFEERSVRRVELSATDAGRPLYARYGFEQGELGISAVVPRSMLDSGLAADDISLTEATPAGAAALAAYDAPRFGGDRRPLLNVMLSDPDRPVLVAHRDGETLGWGWIRPEAERLGPLVADVPSVALALIAETFGRLPATSTLRLNMTAANRSGMEALRAADSTFETWDGRMGRGPDVSRRDEMVYASAVGALG